MTFPEDLPDVAAEVRAYMARHRITIRKIADELGLGEAYLARRISGKVPFRVDELLALAQLLDVPVTVFFARPNVVDIGERSRNLRSKTDLVAAA